MVAPPPSGPTTPYIRIARDQAQVMARLSKYFPPTQILQWLETPHRLLNYERPSVLIAQGRTNEVMAVIDAIDRAAATR
jgi:uncharacterized protein (DUF2384 family)